MGQLENEHRQGRAPFMCTDYSGFLCCVLDSGKKNKIKFAHLVFLTTVI